MLYILLIICVVVVSLTDPLCLYYLMLTCGVWLRVGSSPIIWYLSIQMYVHICDTIWTVTEARNRSHCVPYEQPQHGATPLRHCITEHARREVRCKHVSACHDVTTVRVLSTPLFRCDADLQAGTLSCSAC
jgi:hypothetical protein